MVVVVVLVAETADSRRWPIPYPLSSTTQGPGNQAVNAFEILMKNEWVERTQAT